MNIRWATEDPNPKMQEMSKRKAVEMTRQAIESKLPGDVIEAENQLEGAQTAGIAKRIKLEPAVNTAAEGPIPTLYQGTDGQYYYDYGAYGYNHETQQYDPARLDQYQGQAAQSPTTPLSLQDRVKASLQSTTTAISVTTPFVSPKEKDAKPVASALGALAAYGSDSEDDDEN